MQRTKIDWCDYSLNPIRGLCPVGCSYCYARRLYKRYHWNEDIQWVGYGGDLRKIKPSRIFVGSTMELFGDWIDPFWMRTIFNSVREHPQHTFIFLTKRPENLPKWTPFPVNAWVGVSVTNHRMFHDASYYLQRITAPVRFYSFEPLLERINLTEPNPYFMGNWVIIGRQTPVSAKTAPKVESVREIIEAADKANTPVFLKNNLPTILLVLF